MATRVRKRVTKPAEERVEQLLDAAEKLFAERGIEATTVEDITRAAGIAKGTFYLHFVSKDHLIAALKNRLFGYWSGGIESLPPPEEITDWFAIPETVMERMVDYMFKHRELVHLLTHDLYDRDARELIDQEARAVEMTADGIRAGVEAGAFHTNDPLLAATLIHHAVFGAVVHALAGAPSGLSKARVIRASKELIRKLLAPSA